MSKERINWIDICRGIGILSVIYAHGLDGHSIRYLFYAFHIPLFFFLSGVVFHHKNHESFFQIVKKACKNILLPYFLFALLSYGAWLIFTQFSQFSLTNLPKTLFNILYGNGNGKQFFYNAVLWFLPVLFVTRISFGVITMISTKPKFLIPTLIVCSIIGHLVPTLFLGFTLPFGSEIVFSSTVFFGVGYVVNANLERMRRYLINRTLIITLLSALSCIVFATINHNLYGHQIDMRLNRLDNYFLFYIAAISGIISCVAISLHLKSQKLLQFLGKHSMPLFIWHLILFSLISKVLMIWITPQMINKLRNIYLAPTYTIISIVIITGILLCFRKLRALNIIDQRM